ncbi:MAG TPA: hypothetical protein VMV09_09475 [Candidatus Saccharimonadales bacterium]|nr:hypothetical protein [Candidatus Saccharimonadales bacterium]
MRQPLVSVRHLYEHVFVPASRDVELPRCGACQEHKPLDQFNWRRKKKGQRDSLCRTWRSAYKHDHYVKNRQRYIDNTAERKQRLATERATFLIEYFRTHPCSDCGESDPIVLEFDHRSHKLFNVAKGLRDHSWQAVLEEIGKCDVVWANCHRRRTSHSLGWARAAAARL